MGGLAGDSSQAGEICRQTEVLPLMELARSDWYRDLVRDLIVNYYDINYRKPSLSPVETFSLEEGILQDKPRLLQSKLINDLVTFGENSFEKTEDKLVVKL